MHRIRWASLFLFPFLFLCGSSGVSAETITVGAAISLKETVTALQKDYEVRTGDRLRFTFGSSGQVMAQIKNGADVDLFISAANQQVDELIKQSLADEKTRKIVAGNQLVLIVPADARDAPMAIKDLANAKYKRIAIGSPQTVPAGQYAMQVLQHEKLVESLGDRLIYGNNVRQVLDYVQRGEVAAGLVYLTDAREAGDKVKIVATVEESSHDAIVYPAILISASRKKAAAQKFLDYLGSEDAQRVLKANVFTLPALKAEPARPATK